MRLFFMSFPITTSKYFYSFSCLLEVKYCLGHYWFLFPIFCQGMTVVTYGFLCFQVKTALSEIYLSPELSQKGKDQPLIEWCRETLAGKYLAAEAEAPLWGLKVIFSHQAICSPPLIKLKNNLLKLLSIFVISNYLYWC